MTVAVIVPAGMIVRVVMVRSMSRIVLMRISRCGVQGGIHQKCYIVTYLTTQEAILETERGLFVDRFDADGAADKAVCHVDADREADADQRIGEFLAPAGKTAKSPAER